MRSPVHFFNVKKNQFDIIIIIIVIVKTMFSEKQNANKYVYKFRIK